MALMDLELKILAEVPESGALRPYAYAVWAGQDGSVEMGPVRIRRSVVQPDDTAGWEYDCSPIPGAWVQVPESRIMRVRHLGAMGLHNMTCVCRGTWWDSPCPAPDCKTPART